MSVSLTFKAEADAQEAVSENPGASMYKSARGGRWIVSMPDRYPEVVAKAVTQGIAGGAAAIDAHAKEQARAEHQAKVRSLGGYEKLADVLATHTFTEWLVRDFIERGVIAILVGPRGSYKTAVASDAAMRVALNGQPVLVISAEGPRGFQRRAQAWLDEFDGGLTDPTAIPLYVRRRRVNLSAREQIEIVAGWRAEIEQATGKPVALIVVDTLRKNSTHKENDNDETSNLIGAIDTHLRHHAITPATCLLVHHTGHSDQTRGRGASSLAADTDAEYVVSFKNGTVTVTRERFKDSPSLPPLYFNPAVRALSYKDPEGNPVTSIVLKSADAPAKPVQDLRDSQREFLEIVTRLYQTDGKPLSLDRIGDGRPEPHSVLKRKLEPLVNRGLLMVEGGLYSVPPSIVCDP